MATSSKLLSEGMSSKHLLRGVGPGQEDSYVEHLNRSRKGSLPFVVPYIAPLGLVVVLGVVLSGCLFLFCVDIKKKENRCGFILFLLLCLIHGGYFSVGLAVIFSFVSRWAPRFEKI